MRVTRMSGMPIEPEDIPKYQADLEAGLEKINQELGRFEKLSQKEQGEFVRRFQDMRKEIQGRYKLEDNWDFETVVKSKQNLKKMINCYGAIAFGRDSETNKICCYIMDK